MWWCLLSTAGATPPLTAAMHERFSLLYETRDHVIQGRLNDARETSRSLGDVHIPDGLPSEWAKAMKQLRKTSRRAAKSSDLVEAAAGVGRIAQQCGACHATTKGGPGIAQALDLPPQQWDEGQNMALHAWATEWMWLGLLAAEDGAWLRGAEALDDKPLPPRFANAPAPTDQPQLEQLVYILANRALDVPVAERGALMGQLLATCAECHVTERDAR